MTRFLQKLISAWMERVGRVWSNIEDRNVCLVDWRRMANTLYHRAAEEHTVTVGRYIAQFIKQMYIKPEETSIVGHSLGAHVAGFCGKALNGKLAAIYGKYFYAKF